MKKIISLILCTLAIIAAAASASSKQKTNSYELINQQKHRLVVLADMGNEEDEKQQIMHLLMYANEIDIEGLIAVSGKFLHKGRFEGDHYKHHLHPEIFHELIDGYEKVLPNIKLHAQGWPSAQYLRSIVKNGTDLYGMKGVGKGMANEASKYISELLKKNDPRPIYFVGNAGTNVLAQALYDYRETHSKQEVEALLKKIIMYENGSQDDAGGWIMHNFPSIHWIRSNYQTYGFMGYKRVKNGAGPYTWQPYPETSQGQHGWAKEHIQTGHGALGAEYPDRFKGNGFLEGGGTTPWLGLITRGLYDPYNPHWGGWSGRYTKDKVLNEWSRHKGIAANEQKYGTFKVFADTADNWTDPDTGKNYQTILTPIQRWRKDILEDFKARMDWCLQPLKAANHNPIAVIDGISERVIFKTKAKAGQTLTFDASGSYDPDKGQKLSFNWWVYPEAGTYKAKVNLGENSKPTIKFKVPSDAAGHELHLILEIADDSKIAKLKDYRRIVVAIN